MKIEDIVNILDELAPFKDAESWDNVGLLVGDENDDLLGAVLALDATIDVINYAKDNNANLIVTHHPVIFSPIKSVHKNDILYNLIENNINVICAHTNLDRAGGGVNYALADSLKLSNIRQFENKDKIGLIGDLPYKMKSSELALYIKKQISSERMSYIDSKNAISNIAICGGAGGDYFQAATESGADSYLTGEVKHNIYIDAINNSYSIFTPGHHETEVLVLNNLKKYLLEKGIKSPIFLYEDSNIKTC